LRSQTAFRIFTIVFTLVTFGFSGDPSLKSIKAGNQGALVDVNVGRFGDAPAPVPAALPASEKPAVEPGRNEYDFSVEEVEFRESSFFANGSQAASVKMLARNRGHAPVSVNVTYDRAWAQNMKYDAKNSYTSVVPPQSEMVIARFDPASNHTNWKLALHSSWQIGDHTARHACPGGYRLPFANDVPAYANVADEQGATSYARNVVMFSIPANTVVLAARRGVVARIRKNNDIDMVHDDSTIATYSHLAGVAREISVGKAVEAGEPLGAAGKAVEGGYVQLAVWRPEQKAAPTLEDNNRTVFQPVSFPLEFCIHTGDCRILNHSQAINAAPPAPAALSRPAARTAAGEYDFSLIGDNSADPPSTPGGPASARIIAVNNGFAPVSVTFDFNYDQTENIRPDVSLPFTAVILPQSEMVLARLFPVDSRKGMKHSCKYTWQLGDYTAGHQCPEHYRYPFAGNVRAFASVAGPQDADPFARYSVQFSLPAGSKVLAARNGMVVRVRKDNDIEILHDDSTIATYSHLGKLEKGVLAGKRISAGDVLGVAEKSDKPGMAYMQITVWRPEQPPTGTLFKRSVSASFLRTSFPMEFCSDANDCRVFTHNQLVSMKSAARKGKVE